MSPNRLSPLFLESRRTMNTETQTTAEPNGAATPDSNRPAMPDTFDNSPVNTTSLSDVSEENPGSSPSSSPTTTAPPKGPLSTLAEKAAHTEIGRKASEKLPESARPTLDRASRALHTVDDHLLAAKGTLETDEGRRLVNSACEFASSVVAFLAMLFTIVVAFAEKKLDMQPTDESCAWRFVRVGREGVCLMKNRVQSRETESDGSCEAWAYSRGRRAIEFLSVMFKSSLKALSEFSGPGKDVVVPVADKIILMLPEDLQTAVRESEGPITSLRNELGCDDAHRAGSHDGEARQASPQGERAKVD